MAEATTLYICPTCGCPDLMIAKSSLLVAAKERRTECPNCKWAGTLAEASGIATTEKIYDTQTILNLLLYTVTKHAAGPIAQAFQFFGLLEKDDKEGLDHIMREATAGLIEKAFMAAAENAAKRGQIGTSEETKQTCPWCGGRHIIGEEHNFETGQPDHCPKCGGKGVLTPDEISKFEEEDWPRKRDKEETLVGRIKLPPGVRAEDVEIKHGGSMSVVNLAAVEKLTIVSGDPEMVVVDEGVNASLKELLDRPLRCDSILMDQGTAREFGVDVDALLALSGEAEEEEP